MKIKAFVAVLAATGLGTALLQAQVTVSSYITNGIAEPYNIVVDDSNNFYISDSIHNRVLRVDSARGVASTLAGLPDQPAGNEDGPAYVARFNNPQGLVWAAVGGQGGVLVADTGNHLIRFVRASDGQVSTLAGIADPPPPGYPVGGYADGGLGVSQFDSPLGMATDNAGRIYIADSGNDLIRVLDLATLQVTTLTVNGTTFNKPNGLAFGGANRLWVADTFNHKVKLLNLTSATSADVLSELGSGLPEHRDSTFGATAQFNWPRGLAWWDAQAMLLVCDTGNHVIRAVTNNTLYGANNYTVTTFAGVPKANGFVDGLANLARFDTPIGLALDGEVESFLITDLKNNAIRRIQYGEPKPQVAAPRIGWVDFVYDEMLGAYVTLLRTAADGTVFRNDRDFAILPGPGEDDEVNCVFTSATTTLPLGLTVNCPDPSKAPGDPFTKPRKQYVDGELRSVYMERRDQRRIAVERSTDGGVVIKAMAYEVGRPSSPIVTTRFGFKVGDPSVTGNNLAQFAVSSSTTDPSPRIHFTTDGSDPFDGSTNIVENGSQITSLEFAEGQERLIFKMRAFADNFKPSEIVTNVFFATNYVPNRISFGFAQGEATSEFVAAPGQTFYAPVTLTMLPGTKIYSLQFNLTVEAQGAAPAVWPGAVGFESSLIKPDETKSGTYLTIPPATYWPLLFTTNVFVVTNVADNTVTWYTNLVVTTPSDPPPTNKLIYPFEYYQPYLELRYVNPFNNLVGVGWLERYGEANLYDTKKQDLVRYSMPHDTIFNGTLGKVVAGLYHLRIPPNAALGHAYRIAIGRPSATDDGVGGVDSSVKIETPTNAVVAGGYLRAITNVVVGEPRAYVVGDAAPFGWFNAGDFGNGRVLNDDVMQVFQSVIYGYNRPPYADDSWNGYGYTNVSDFFDTMDAGCIKGALQPDGTYLPATSLAGAAQNPLFYGSDLDINDIAFGDGELNVTDLYITFRRSLDPSLRWFKRYWSGGQRVAVPAANQYYARAAKDAGSTSSRGTKSDGPASSEPPALQLLAGDIIAAPGQTVQIPVTARVQGSYPLRVLLLNLSVRSLNGAPALTDAVTFTPTGVLGLPTSGFTRQSTAGCTAAWLNSAVAGVSGDAVLGTLTIKIPAEASASAAYAIVFDHASGSPNGLAAFPCQYATGLITLADRSGSSVGDGIPDSWRMRHFGSVFTVLGNATADADGDGHRNREEYLTGTNPNDAQSVLKMMSPKAGGRFAVRWPSVAGKQYIIERAAALFGAEWQAVDTRAGSGWEMTYEDPDQSTAPRFYRVRVAE